MASMLSMAAPPHPSNRVADDGGEAAVTATDAQVLNVVSVSRRSLKQGIKEFISVSYRRLSGAGDGKKNVVPVGGMHVPRRRSVTGLRKIWKKSNGDEDLAQEEAGGDGAAAAEEVGQGGPMQVLFNRTLVLLNRDDFQSADPSSFKGLVTRLRMMHEAGLPRMRLIPGKVLEELGRIPRSTELRENGEPYTVDALEELEAKGVNWLGKPNVFIAFFSHRWIQANYSTLHDRDVVWGSSDWWEATTAEGHYVGKPDSPSHDKVRDLLEWMKWLKWKTSMPTPFMEDYIAQKCDDIYFFIDWSCVDQTNPVAEIAALPAFVSSCTLIASYWTEEYRGRAWCQAELLMARAFCALPVVMRVREGFKHEEQAFVTSSRFTLPDPSDRNTAMITNEDDRPTIEGLTNCGRQSKAFTYNQCSKKVGGGYMSITWWLLMSISMGFIPFLFRRKVIPGESPMQVVEPSINKYSYSWEQVKLWFHLCPGRAVASCTCAASSFIFIFGSVRDISMFTDDSVWNASNSHQRVFRLGRSISLVLLALLMILGSALHYPSNFQNASQRTRLSLMAGSCSLIMVALGGIGYCALSLDFAF